MAKRYFLGVRKQARPNYLEFCTELQPASNLVNPEPIRKDLEKKEYKRREQASVVPYHSYLAEVVLLDEAGEQAFAARGGTAKCSAAGPLLSFLSMNLDSGDETDSPAVGTLIGFAVHENLAVARADAMYENARSQGGEQICIPPELFIRTLHDSSAYIDPYTALVPHDLRVTIDLPGLCHFLGIEITTDFSAGDAAASAMLARRLVLAGGL